MASKSRSHPATMKGMNHPARRVGAFFLVLAGLAALLSPAQAAAPSFRSYTSNVLGSNGTSLAINLPSGTAQGDFLLAAIATDGAATFGALTGWTLLNTGNSSSECTLAVYYRFAGWGEPANYTFTWTGGEQAAGTIVCYSGVDAGSPINVSGVDTGTGTSTPTTVTAPAVTTTVADTMVVRVYGADDDATSTPPSGYTEEVDISSNTGGGTCSLGLADASQAAAGTTGPGAFSYQDTEQWRAMTIALAPRYRGCANYQSLASPTSLSGVINTYYPGVTGTVSRGATSIPVGTLRPTGATAIAAGDLLLVMQMQYADIDATNSNIYGDGIASTPANGATSYASGYTSVGAYEYVVATGAVSGGSVPIAGEGPSSGTVRGLLNTYVQAVYGTQGQRTYQVVRVPQYQAATVTGSIIPVVWDGNSGGVVALEVLGALTFSGGGITVSGYGFRGGGGEGLTGNATPTDTDYRNMTTYAVHGNKGEGVAGTPRYVYDLTGAVTNTGVEGYPNGSRARGAPGNAGGGGTDDDVAANQENSGGGGGGNGGAGGIGGNSWRANQAIGGHPGAAFASAPGRLVMGGGGGSGARNNSTGVQSSGGIGGGIIIVRANSITGTATLSANAAWPTTDNYTPANDGSGGGGAGGSVLVFARTGTLTSLTIQAQGATGASNWIAQDPGTPYPANRHGPGGGGGGGAIYQSSAAGSTSVTGGAAGVTCNGGGNYGSAAGSAGSVTTLTESQIPGTTTDATCSTTLAGISDFRAVRDGGRVFIQWRTTGEIGTLGFHVERLNERTGIFERLTGHPLPGLFAAAQGGTYRWLDPGARPGGTYTYRLVEQDIWDSGRRHGPYTVTADASSAEAAAADTELQSPAGSGYDDPAAGFQAAPAPLRPKSQAGPHFTGSGGLSPIATRLLPATGMTPPAPGLTALAGSAQVNVRQDGLVFMPATDLAAAAGTGADTISRAIRNGLVALRVNGKDVSWLGSTDASGLYFYGQCLDSLFTLDNVYRFGLGRGKQMSVLSSQPSGPVPAGVFTDTTTFEEDHVAATYSVNDPAVDYWFWDGFIGGATPGWSVKTFSLDLPGASAGASLTIDLYGVSQTSHPVEVWFNGQQLGSRTIAGLGALQLTFPLSGTSLADGPNTVKIIALGDSENMFFLNRFTVTYQRKARAVADRLKISVNSTGAVSAEGFSGPDIFVLDVTKPLQPVSVAGLRLDTVPSGYRVTFNGQARHQYLLAGATAVSRPAPYPVWVGNLQRPDRVDYVVITQDGLYPGADNLAQLRRQRGLRSRVATLEAIYNEFNNGIVDPNAIRSFLKSAAVKWGSRYAVMVGSGTYDYRDLLGMGDNLVPTLMAGTPYGLYACDGGFADFLGNGVPQMVVSRIPAADESQLDAYLDKLGAYEDSNAPPPAKVLMLADQSDPDAGGFPADSDTVAALVPPSVLLDRVYLSDYAPDAARQLTLEGINEGVFWVNYIGHGGMDRLADSGLLMSGDGDLLDNIDALPVLSSLTCAVNRFEVPGLVSLGEELVLDPDGGAIAVWAPSGLSQNSPAVNLDMALFKAVFQTNQPILGDAVRQALSTEGEPVFMLKIYNLLGDGALLLNHPRF